MGIVKGILAEIGVFRKLPAGYRSVLVCFHSKLAEFGEIIVEMQQISLFSNCNESLSGIKIPFFGMKIAVFVSLNRFFCLSDLESPIQPIG